jgi:branched-chain amino acid transport system ATP-binding protein
MSPAFPTPTPPEPTSSRDVLEIHELAVAYDRAVRVLHGVSLRVPAGGFVALLGANGAGKSTLLRAVSGTLPLHGGSVTSGSVSFGGQELTGRSTSRIVTAGLVQVPEGRRVFADLSVEDNLRTGRLGLTRRHRSDIHAAMAEVFELFPVLAEMRRKPAGLLSGGEQQMLALGRGLMARPRMLLLDEPSLGLAPQMVERIARTVAAINRAGTAILLVEQNAALALTLADHAYVLDSGRIKLQGPAAELAATDEVRRLYLGESSDGAPASDGESHAALSRWTG